MSPRSRSRATSSPVDLRLGVHPSPPNPFGAYFQHTDSVTPVKVPHRALTEQGAARGQIVPHLKAALTKHHASPEQLVRNEAMRQAMQRQGIPVPPSLRRFPVSDKTRKGNFAEVVLAEYISAVSGLELPVYRLRYNPNVDQSMKGDDVLAFDLDSEPVRIVVGEAKFRETPSKKAVTDIADCLVRSFTGGLPASLQFVADRLYEQQRADLGARVAECAARMAEGRLRLDYVGLLFSDARAGSFVQEHTPSFHRLVMLSAGVPSPTDLVDDCYRGLT